MNGDRDVGRTKTEDQLLREGCCNRKCHHLLSRNQIIEVRSGILQSVGVQASRVQLRGAIRTYIASRVDMTALRAALDGEIKWAAVNVTIGGGLTLCRSKFVDLLGISLFSYDGLIQRMASGDAIVPSRTTRSFSDNVVRSLARVAVSSSIHGQYSPLDTKHLMLDRGESLTHYLRTTASGSRLDPKMVVEIIGVKVRRRAADAFMHCDTCTTLTQRWKKMKSVLEVARTAVGTRLSSASSSTAAAHCRRVLCRRKMVLYSLCDSRYSSKRSKLAASRGVKPEAVSVLECVDDADVQVDRYIELLNARTKAGGVYPTLQPFKITKKNVLYCELADLPEDAVIQYIRGDLAEDDLASLPSGPAPAPSLCSEEQEGMGDMEWLDESRNDLRRVAAAAAAAATIDSDGDLEDDHEVDEDEDEEGEDEDEDEDEEDELARLRDIDGQLDDMHGALRALRDTTGCTEEELRRRMGILTAAEDLVQMRKYHSEHVLAERLMTYSAYETAAQNPRSMMAIIADGMSKEKTKLPRCADRGKKDATVGRLECWVNGIQMVVPGPLNSRRDQSQITSECKRRADLKKLAKTVKECGLDKRHPLARDVLDGQNLTAAKDREAASSFRLVNHDYVTPFGMGGTAGTDSFVSQLLHLLTSEYVTEIPSILVIVIDNCKHTKNRHTIRALALLMELCDGISEIHILLATVGHTHNSLDAHFGALCTAVKRTDLGTPKDLVECAETVKDTHGHLDWPYYVFAKDLTKWGVEYKWVTEQHYFLLFKDNKNDIKMSTKSFLRFAEYFDSRVSRVANETRILPRTKSERENEGSLVFIESEFCRDERRDFAKTVFPLKKDLEFFRAQCTKLHELLQTSGLDAGTSGAQRALDLQELCKQIPFQDVSLYDVCTAINAKTVRVAIPAQQGTQQEMCISQYARLLGRDFSSNHLQMYLTEICKNAVEKFCKEAMHVVRREGGSDLAEQVASILRDNLCAASKRRQPTDGQQQANQTTGQPTDGQQQANHQQTTGQPTGQQVEQPPGSFLAAAVQRQHSEQRAPDSEGGASELLLAALRDIGYTLDCPEGANQRWIVVTDAIGSIAELSHLVLERIPPSIGDDRRAERSRSPAAMSLFVEQAHADGRYPPTSFRTNRGMRGTLVRTVIEHNPADALTPLVRFHPRIAIFAISTDDGILIEQLRRLIDNYMTRACMAEKVMKIIIIINNLDVGTNMANVLMESNYFDSMEVVSHESIHQAVLRHRRTVYECLVAEELATGQRARDEGVPPLDPATLDAVTRRNLGLLPAQEEQPSGTGGTSSATSAATDQVQEEQPSGHLPITLVSTPAPATSATSAATDQVREEQPSGQPSAQPSGRPTTTVADIEREERRKKQFEAALGRKEGRQKQLDEVVRREEEAKAAEKRLCESSDPAHPDPYAELIRQAINTRRGALSVNRQTPGPPPLMMTIRSGQHSRTVPRVVPGGIRISPQSSQLQRLVPEYNPDAPPSFLTPPWERAYHEREQRRMEAEMERERQLHEDLQRLERNTIREQRAERERHPVPTDDGFNYDGLPASADPRNFDPVQLSRDREETPGQAPRQQQARWAHPAPRITGAATTRQVISTSQPRPLNVPARPSTFNTGAHYGGALFYGGGRGRAQESQPTGSWSLGDRRGSNRQNAPSRLTQPTQQTSGQSAPPTRAVDAPAGTAYTGQEPETYIKCAACGKKEELTAGLQSMRLDVGHGCTMKSRPICRRCALGEHQHVQVLTRSDLMPIDLSGDRDETTTTGGDTEGDGRTTGQEQGGDGNETDVDMDEDEGREG